MSDKRYEANIIRTTAVEPANNLETTSAPGVWSIDEVVELQKKNKWPTAGNVATDVTDVFSTFLYAGDGTNGREINNGIDLSGKGGMVWFKARTTAQNHRIFDTARGSDYSLITNTSAAQADHGSGGLNSFDNDGFTLGNAVVNGSGIYGGDYASWTWRKQAKYFDIVQYTGNNGTQTINHNLGSVPGMIIVKRLNDAGNWSIYHRSLGATKFINLNSNAQAYTNSSYWADTEPTSTQFTVGLTSSVDSAPYIAYLFAHNNNDGGFGPSSDQDIIKCGSFSTDSSGDASVTLGFEPQWLMIKRHDGTSNWTLMDIMRGYNNTFWNPLYADTTNAESGFAATRGFPTSTGFEFDGQLSASANYIYMAIRRGPLAQPTSATNVFNITTFGQAGDSTAPAYRSTFPVDMYFEKNSGSTSDWYISSRLTGNKYMKTNSNAAEVADSNLDYDYMNGVYTATGTNGAIYGWMWKRAPGYFDVVAYTGNGTQGRTINHNLGVAPEMMWVKRRSGVDNWTIYAGDATSFLRLNTTDQTFTSNLSWNDTAPTASVFSVGNHNLVNGSGETYTAYLFATVAGVSKVGSYTGTGSAQNIECGFSSGAKFVLIKKADDSGHWQIYDTSRGLVSGNDPRLALNLSSAELGGYDFIDPYSGGFAVTTMNDTNENGYTYIFYAIAT